MLNLVVSAMAMKYVRGADSVLTIIVTGYTRLKVTTVIDTQSLCVTANALRPENPTV